MEIADHLTYLHCLLIFFSSRYNTTRFSDEVEALFGWLHVRFSSPIACQNRTRHVSLLSRCGNPCAMWQVKTQNIFAIMCRSQRPSIFDASHSGTANQSLDHCHGSIMCTKEIFIFSFVHQYLGVQENHRTGY